jgi:uncharacterized protein YqhQ
MSKPKFDFAVGGQAVIEGVMMRSKNFIAVAVRKENGEIVTKDQKFQSLIQKHKWLNIPLLRGVLNMFEMMVVGTKALNWSADIFAEEDSVTKEDRENKSQFWANVFFVFNLLFSLALALFIFKFLPLGATELLNKVFPAIEQNHFLYNFIDAVIKLTIFSGYIALISLSKTIRRVFEYHGAEHKAVFNYEEDSELTVENSAKQSRFHPRCGTSFIIFVFVISILIYMFIPRDPNFMINFVQRIAVLPIIAGISYEILKSTAKNMDKPWVKIFTKPGMFFQKLTTKEPDAEQLQVALVALKRTLELEEKYEG